MSNALTIFDNAGPDLPAHVRELMDEEGSNITGTQKVPSVSYEGKIWSISVDGNKTPLYKTDAEGDEIPVAVMRVIVLDFNARRGRAYYQGSYDPDKPAQPHCWSDDGVKPHPSVPEEQKQCGTCAGCPMAVKGSHVTDAGKQVAACSQHRMLAVVPAAKPDMTPLRLKIAVTSDFDKQSPELEKKGWFAFSQYTDFLNTKGVKHTATLVTKMRFDPNVAYPKIVFSPDRWVTEEEAHIVREQVRSDETAARLNSTYTAAGIDGTKIETAAATDPEETLEQEPEEERAKPAKKPAAKKSAPADIDDEEDEAPAKKPAAKKPAAKKSTAKKPEPQAMDVDDDDDDITIPATEEPKKPAAKKAEAAPAAEADVDTDVPDDLADLLSEWDD